MVKQIAAGGLLNDDLLCLLWRCGESSCLLLALTQPLFSQKMALAPHLYTLAFYLTAREKVGGTEDKEGEKQNEGETDTHREKV